MWAAQVKQTGVVAGTVLLVPLPPEQNADDAGRIEVGWHFHPDSWGHGYATEAAAALLAQGLRRRPVARSTPWYARRTSRRWRSAGGSA